MVNKKLFFISLSLFAIFCVSVHAAGEWTNADVDDSLWSTADNWDAVPTEGSNIFIGEEYLAPAATTAHAYVDIVTPSYASLRVGRTDYGEVTVTPDGVLNYANAVYLGVTPNGTGHLNVNGGTINGNTMNVGWDGDGALTVSGGQLNLATLLRIGADIRDNPGTAVMYLYDGTISASDFRIGSTGTVEIGEGVLIVDGDIAGTVETYIENGKIAAKSDKAIIEFDYNTINPGKTTVFASVNRGACLDSMDNIQLTQWFDGRGYDDLLQQVTFGREGEGAMEIQMADLPDDKYDIIPSRIFSTPLNLTPIDGTAVSFWVYNDNVGDEQVKHVILRDSNGNIARCNVGVTLDGWQKVVIDISDFYHTSGVCDFSQVEMVRFWCSTYPQKGESLFIDDIRILFNRPRSLTRIDMMPNLPQPYQMRDWEQVTKDYDSLIFDLNAAGEYLPTLSIDTTNDNFQQKSFDLPSYLGRIGGGAEAINCIAAVVSASLVDVNKLIQNRHNYVAMCANWYSIDKGGHIIFNNRRSQIAGTSFWYTLLPNILFYQVADLHPYYAENGTHQGNDGYTYTLNDMVQNIADQWYEASYYMGGDSGSPDYDHLGFNFEAMEPYDVDDTHTEPDSAAGIGWLEYMAWSKWQDPNYLIAADWAMQYLQDRNTNPYYEVLMPYGAITAARMNAELGRNYDVDKFISWSLNPDSDARPGWGVMADDKWGNMNCDGLTGSTSTEYAFAMNTFQTLGALMPIVRYDQRYAATLGKFALNLANASRLFYPNGLDAEHQNNRDWADQYDQNYCISYEGLKNGGKIQSWLEQDYSTVYGQVISGTYENTQRWDKSYQLLRQETVSGENRLEHIWKITLHSGTSHQLWVRAKCDPESAFNFSYSTSPTGDYTSIFNFSETSYDHKIKNFAVDENLDGVVYIKVSAANLSGESLKEISIDSIVVESFDPTLQPFGTGDAMKKGQPTNFALYGASHAGILGAVVETTNIEGILQLDLLATDYYRDEAYPTYLYYNPYKTTKYINLDIGYDAVDIYETTSQSMLIRNATGTIQLSIPPESAIVTVLAPSGGEVSISDNKKMIDNVIVDYRTNNSFLDCPQMQASPFRYTADLTGDCKVGMADLVSLAECWLKQDDGQCRGYDISDDGIINMRDYSYISDQWGQKHDF